MSSFPSERVRRAYERYFGESWDVRMSDEDWDREMSRPLD